MFWQPLPEPLATYRYWQSVSLTQADVLEGIGMSYDGQIWDEVFELVMRAYKNGFGS